MKLTKKIIAVFTALIMLFASSIISFAESEFLISINDVNAKAGDEVQFVVELKNNPGIGIITLNIGYDESVLTLKETTAGALKNTFNFNYRIDSDKNPIVVNGTMRVEGDDPESGLNKNDGELVVLIFTVAENAPAGNYPLSFTSKYCSDDYGMPVKNTLKTGILTIEKPHEHSYASSITAPTCTEKGFTTYTCECGETYKDNFVDAIGHTPEVIPGKAATETETGLTDGEKCSVCGVITKEQAEIPVLKHEHTYESVVTAPTCSEKGYTTYTCKCGDTYKDNYVDATGKHVDGDNNNKCDFCDEEIAPPPPDDPGIIGGDYNLGDVNDDGKINAADARIILRAAARLETLTENQTLAADIDGNGKIAASDARIALRISARLDSIDNYIKDEPPVEEPPVEDPPVEERIDLSLFLGMDVNDFAYECPEFVFEDGAAAYDNVAISLNESDCICDITDTGSSGYSVFGVNGNTPYDEARAIFESEGFVFEDDEYAYNYALGVYLWVFVGEDMTAYNVYLMEDEEVLFDTDLAMNIGFDVSVYLDNIIDLIPNDEDDSHYYTSYLDIYTVDGIVSDIIINGECEYSIYGISYGSTYEEAEENLSYYGFVYDAESDCWYNESYEEYVLVYYDENSLVEIVDVFSELDIYPENELFQYLWCDIDDVENDFGELEFYPETEEYYAHYYVDGIYFYVDEFNIVTTIDIEDNEDYCILDIYTGSDLYYVTEMFAINEVYYSCYDDTFVIADDYMNGYTVFVSFDEGIVDYVSVYGSYYNLADYHMADIETVLTEMPYLENDGVDYYIPEFTFEVDEEGYINAVILNSYNNCDINGVYVGMPGCDVEEVLSWSGFTYLHTDEEGYDFYTNSEEDLYMYVLVDGFDEVACVCLY